MTHPLQDYIAGLIAKQLRARHAVVIYDGRSELADFFDEAVGAEIDVRGLRPIALDGARAMLIVVKRSLLEVRAAVEPLTCGDEPANVIIYAPDMMRGDAKSSLLMELEKAGTLYLAPALQQIARNVLRKRLDDVAIDAMLKSESLSYQDLAALCRGDGGGASLLLTIFDTRDASTILATWLANPSFDVEIDRRRAWGELRAMVRGRIGLALSEQDVGGLLRAQTARYLLANEFRGDLFDFVALTASASERLAEIPEPPGKDALRAIQDVLGKLRRHHSEAYVTLADDAQHQLALSVDSVAGAILGSIDTFRFEEMAASRAVIAMIAKGDSEAALKLISNRSDSFWLDRDAMRQTLWEVCRLMVDLGIAAKRVVSDVHAGKLSTADAWVERYASADADAWFRLDLAQRRFETLLSAVEDEIDPVAVAMVRGQYEDAVRLMSEGFVKSLEKGSWAIPATLHHTRIWPDVAAGRARPMAYIFVDAMRYEMGFVLAERLTAGHEVQLRPALAALPSITPAGMAALLPGAASSFSVVQENGKLGARIGGAFLPDRGSRQKFLAAKAPGVVSIDLDAVLSLSAKQLQKRIGEAPLIAIHSTEIDAAGENGFSTASARRIMDNVIGDLELCLRKLAVAGVADAVITADHGHLFFAGDRPNAMRMDAPGGDTVDLHRRCWIGRGGATPPGAVRVSGATLGYDTDLDFVFPISTAVFKSGGDLAFHHGGPSLQEMVVPVLAVKAKRAVAAPSNAKVLTVTHDWDTVTNRIFTLKIELMKQTKDLFAEPRTVKPLILSGGREVAQAALAVGAELQNGRLTLQPQVQVSVGFMMTDDAVKAVRIQVVDADTDAILYASDADIPVKLGL